MNDAPIQIRNPEVAKAIRALARKRGLPITEAVSEAVNAELTRLEGATPRCKDGSPRCATSSSASTPCQ